MAKEQRMIRVRRVAKRSGDKYHPASIGMGHERLVPATMNRKTLLKEGYEIVDENVGKAREARQPQRTAPKPQPIQAQQADNSESDEEAAAQVPSDDLEDRSRDEIKSIADSMGIEYAKNISKKNLVKRIRDYETLS